MATFRKRDRIGSGGFGEVYTCTKDDKQTLYAFKELQASADSDAIKRFKTEVRILSILDHPNIIRIVGKRLNVAPYFYVMPLYKGSLEEKLPSLAASESRIATLFSSILDAIEYAHSQGVLHRDLKPLNVLLNSDVDLVVSDFGLGRIIDSESTRRTYTGQFMGSYYYTAPEQCIDAKHVDERSDIFSLGKLLYAMYSGATPVVQDTSSLPPGVEFIVNKCTQRDPDKRFQSVSDLKSTWYTLFDPSQRDSELGELEALSAELTAPASIDQKKAARLLELMIKYQNDPDLIHERLMELDPEAVAAMHRKEAGAIRGIIHVFTDLVEKQGWPFSYTDKLADKCKAIYEQINDFEIRADILHCLIEIGVGHNRWHVLGIFAELVQLPKSPGEELVARDRLSTVASSVRRHAAGYVKLPKVHRILRPLFDFDIAN